MALSKRARRWLLGVTSTIGILFALLILAVYFAPAIGLKIAANWYANQGDGYELSATDWHFKPFETELALYGVELKHPSSGSGITRLALVSIDLQSQLIFDKTLNIQELTLDGLEIDVTYQQKNGIGSLEVAGLQFPMGADTSVAPVSEQSFGSLFTAWNVAFKNISITDQKIKWNVVVDDVFSRGQIELMQLQVPDFSGDISQSLEFTANFELQKLEISGYQDIYLYKPMHIILDGEFKDLFINPTWLGDVAFDFFHVKFNKDFDVKIDQILMRNVVISEKSQNIKETVLSGVILNKAEKLLFKLDYYDIDDINASYSKEYLDVRVGQQAFSGIFINIDRDENGVLLGSSILHSSDSPIQENIDNKESILVDGAELTESDDALYEGPIDVSDGYEETGLERIKELDDINNVVRLVLSGIGQQIVDTGDVVMGRIGLEDKTIKPEFKSILTIREFVVGKVDGSLESGAFSLTENIPIHVVAGFDRFNKIQIESNLGVFTREDGVYPQGSIQITVRQLDLVAFNAYLIKSMGYQLERGTLDVDANIVINKAQLGGEIKILLRNSRFIPIDNIAIERLRAQISMPVETALELLRDKNGNIYLTIPLSGDLSDPDVGLNDVIQQVTRLAVRTSALFFVGQALQPYTALLGVAVYAGDYLFAIRLDALQYSNDQVELNSEQIENLMKVAQLMQEKKKIEVQACPFVNKEEALKYGDNWSVLARQRGEMIKNWMDDYDKTISSRLSICRPQRGDSAQVVLGVN